MNYWICDECGHRFGSPRGMIEYSTYHAGICEVCGEGKGVTASRNYGYPDLQKAKRKLTE